METSAHMATKVQNCEEVKVSPGLRNKVRNVDVRVLGCCVVTEGHFKK